MGDEYRAVNKANWDERAPAHAVSSDYAVEQFVSDPEFVSAVVEFDRPMLGDISGLRGVHLQCHIGTDTVSRARLGARMTGLDFSGASLAEARKLMGGYGSLMAKIPLRFEKKGGPFRNEVSVREPEVSRSENAAVFTLECVERPT